MVNRANDARPSKMLKEAYDRADIPPGAKRRIYDNVFVAERKAYPSMFKSFAMQASFGVAIAAVSFVVTFFILNNRDNAGDSNIYETYITSVSGNSLVAYNGSFDPVKNSSILYEGAEIQTENQASVMMNIGPHRTVLSRSSVLKLKSLKKDSLEFVLKTGSVELDVTPLKKNASLKVFSDDLVVAVVGTKFSVSKFGNCTDVSVSHGKVKVSRAGQEALVETGNSKSFCRGKRIASDILTAKDNIETNDTEVSSKTPKERKPVKKSIADVDSEDFEKPVEEETMEKLAESEEDKLAFLASRSLTEEEKLFKRAQYFHAVDENNAKALALFKEYLLKYPKGVFTEEALFNIIRLSFITKRKNDVLIYARNFLQLFKKESQRKTEVSILFTQSLLELNESPHEAFKVLRPLTGDINSVPESYIEQVYYLYALSALRTGNNKIGEKWINNYLKRFPKGIYAGEAIKHID